MKRFILGLIAGMLLSFVAFLVIDTAYTKGLRDGARTREAYELGKVQGRFEAATSCSCWGKD